MKKLFFLIFFLICTIPGFSQTQEQLIESYNQAFYSKKYNQAILIVETLMASAPENVDFKRERIKMSGATDNVADFVKFMKQLRLQNNPKAIPTFYEILNSEFVSDRFRETLRAYYESQNDEFITKTWAIHVKRVLDFSKMASFPIRTSNLDRQNSYQPPTSSVSRQGPPLCYVSRTGEKYHKSPNCSTTSKTTLIPLYDLSDVKRKTTGPCKNCWSGSPL